MSSGKGGDTVQQEREERGWWSLRFQSVLRETLGRQDVASIGALVLGDMANKAVQSSKKSDIALHEDSLLFR